MNKQDTYLLIEDLDFSISNFKHRHYTNVSSKRMQKEIVDKLEEIKSKLTQKTGSSKKEELKHGK